MPHDIKGDKEGNIYLTGSFQKEVNFGTFNLTSKGGTEFFLVKYSPEGKVLWAQQSKSNKRSLGKAIAIDGSNIFAPGEFYDQFHLSDYIASSKGSRDIFIIKYDTDGQLLWGEALGGSEEDIVNNIQAKNQNVLFIGSFSGSIGKNAFNIKSRGKSDILWGSLDNDGEVLFIKNLGGEYEDEGRQIEFNPYGDLIISGMYKDKLNIKNEEIISEGGSDIFIATFNPNDSLISLNSVGGNGQDDVTSLISLQNYIIFTGFFSNQIYNSEETIMSLGNSDVLLGRLHLLG